MRIANMGQVSLASQGCSLGDGTQTQDGKGYWAIIFDQSGAQKMQVSVPSLTFVDVQPPGSGPYRVRVTLDETEGSLLIDVSGVGADDTVCVVGAPGIAQGTAGVCAAPA